MYYTTIWSRSVCVHLFQAPLLILSFLMYHYWFIRFLNDLVGTRLIMLQPWWSWRVSRRGFGNNRTWN